MPAFFSCSCLAPLSSSAFDWKFECMHQHSSCFLHPPCLQSQHSSPLFYIVHCTWHWQPYPPRRHTSHPRTWPTAACLLGAHVATCDGDPWSWWKPASPCVPQTFTGQGDTNVVLPSSHLLEKSEENEASRAKQTKHVCSALLTSDFVKKM